jgi:hypothetical protein
MMNRCDTEHKLYAASRPVSDNSIGIDIDTGVERDIDDDTLMITVGHNQRDRRISSECDEMLRELYCDIDKEISNDIDDNEYIVETNDIYSHTQAIKIDYEWNYKRHVLAHICGFYGLKKGRTKREIIESIVEFETDPKNNEIVVHRKQIFEFMHLMKEHHYMKQFILFP